MKLTFQGKEYDSEELGIKASDKIDGISELKDGSLLISTNGKSFQWKDNKFIVYSTFLTRKTLKGSRGSKSHRLRHMWITLEIFRCRCYHVPTLSRSQSKD